VVVGAFIFGMFVLAAVVVLGLAGWIVFAIRGWWLRRNGVEPVARAARQSATESEIIEAEYTVISRRHE
jgi:hypothetical protein